MNKTLIVAVAIMAMCAVASAQYQPVYRAYPVQQQQPVQDQFYNDIQQYEREAPRLELHERREREDYDDDRDEDRDEEEFRPRFREMRGEESGAEESSAESSKAESSGSESASGSSKASESASGSKASEESSAKASGASEESSEGSKKSEESSEGSKASEESSEGSKKSEESSEGSKAESGGEESSEASKKESSEASKKESSEHVVKEKAVPAFNIDTPAVKKEDSAADEGEALVGRDMHVHGAPDSDEEMKKDAELAEAMQSVKDKIVHKATQIKAEKKWVREVTQIIEHYVLKTRRVNLNIHTLQKEVKTLYRRKKQIENIQVQRRLEKKLQIAHKDLQTLQSALTNVHQRENKFSQSKSTIKGTIGQLTEELRKLRGEPKEGEEGAAQEGEMSEMAEASAGF